MTARSQIQFVLFKDDHERLLRVQKELIDRTEVKLPLAGILRLFIRVCPLEQSVNMKALEIVEDDRRKDRGRKHKSRLYRLSCVLTLEEEEKLELLTKLISPVLRPKIKQSSLGRLVLRLTESSLIMLHTRREIFFNDLRRRDTQPTEKPKRKAR
jgi:hypothetical protein